MTEPVGVLVLSAVRHAGSYLPELLSMPDVTVRGIVEEMVDGERFTSPSVQVDILPDGEVEVLATHEQELGGDDGQVYVGCRFPADPAYAPDLAVHGRKVGESPMHCIE